MRVSGTRTARGDYRQPWRSAWAEASLSGHTLSLTAFTFALTDTSAWWPVPPESARIAFTVLGRIRRPRPGRVPVVLQASPNPFRRGTELAALPGTRLEVLDVTGRRRAVLSAGPAGRSAWDGRDRAGQRLPPGLYFVRAPGVAASLRLVKLE